MQCRPPALHQLTRSLALAQILSAAYLFLLTKFAFLLKEEPMQNGEQITAVLQPLQYALAVVLLFELVMSAAMVDLQRADHGLFRSPSAFMRWLAVSWRHLLYLIFRVLSCSFAVLGIWRYKLVHRAGVAVATASSSVGRQLRGGSLAVDSSLMSDGLPSTSSLDGISIAHHAKAGGQLDGLWLLLSLSIFFEFIYFSNAVLRPLPDTAVFKLTLDRMIAVRA